MLLPCLQIIVLLQATQHLHWPWCFTHGFLQGNIDELLCRLKQKLTLSRL
jgi:hypothetical protein